MSGMAEVLSAHAFVVLDFDQRGGACFCGEEFKWKLPTIHSKINALAAHQAAMLTAAGFGPVKGEKRLMQLAALMAYDAVEENVKREAGAVALEGAADEVTCGTQEIPRNDYANTGLSDAVLWHEVRSWLRATAAAVRGEG